MRRSFKSIHYRRAESPRGNAFGDHEVETERVELAHMAKKVGRSFSQILPFAQVSHRRKFQRTAVSTPPQGDLEIASPRAESNLAPRSRICTLVAT